MAVKLLHLQGLCRNHGAAADVCRLGEILNAAWPYATACSLDVHFGNPSILLFASLLPDCATLLFRLQDARVAAQARRAAGGPQTPLQAMLQRPLQASVVAVLIALHKVFALLCPAAVLVADSCTSRKFVTS